MSLLIGIKQANGSIITIDLERKDAGIRIKLSPAHSGQRKLKVDWYLMPKDKSGRPVKTGSLSFSRHRLEDAAGNPAKLEFIREGKHVVLARQGDAGRLVPLCTVPTHRTAPAVFFLKAAAAAAYAGIVAAGILFLLSRTLPGLDPGAILRLGF